MTSRNSTLLPSEQDFSRMRADVLTRVGESDRKRTRRHRFLAAGIAGTLVAAATTGGALAVALAPQGEQNYTADCYSAADTGARHINSLYLPGDLDETTALPVSQRVSLAEDMCTQTWKVGTFSNDKSLSNEPSTNNIPNPENFPVPSLATCEQPDGVLAVFPSSKPAEELCDSLGLATPHN